MPKFSQDILKEIEMDDEFKEIVEKYAEKELTPMEMDLKVRMDRVMYILNRALAMIQVMIYLPNFLENDAEILKEYVKPQDAYFILRLFNKYGSSFDIMRYRGKNYPDYTEVLDKTNIRRQPNKFVRYLSTSQDPLPHPQISHMIGILFNNKCIRQMVRSGDKRLITYDKSVTDFLNTMENFKRVVKEKIYVTGEEEDLMDKELRQAYKHNVLVVASINELEARLIQQRADLEEQLTKKVAIFTKYNQRMEKIKEDFKFRTECSLAESEKEMMNRTVISEEKQLHLAEDAKKMTKQFEALLEEHLSAEKVTRSKRFKTETQLHNWLMKYDQDIGERQAEYEAFKAKFDEEKAAMEGLEELFEDQDEEYTYLMKEKAEEEERIYNEMAYHFLVNRCARVIQRAWKAYIERKKARRKGKKGKDGKGHKAKGKKDLEGAMSRKLTEKPDIRTHRAEDPNAMLGQSKKFKADVFDEIQDPHAFDKKDVNVDL